MQKELVDVHRNSKAVCVAVVGDSYKDLVPAVAFSASVGDNFLFANEEPKFAKNLREKSKMADICYLTIKDIDKVDTDCQQRYVGLVKDREIGTYKLPDNCIIVLTVENEACLQKIATDLYKFTIFVR